MEDLLEADDQSGAPQKNILVVRARAQDSADLEAREAAMIAFDQTLDGQLPIPFYADGEIEPLGEYAVKTLIALGITVDEYLQLVRSQ